MREYEFSLIRILPYKDRIVNSVLIRENTGQWKPAFSHILCRKCEETFTLKKRNNQEQIEGFHERNLQNWRLTRRILMV